MDVPAWWDEPQDIYSSRERAAIRLTEEATDIGEGVSDENWNKASAIFEGPEMVELFMAVSAINASNRLTVRTHQPSA